MCPVKAGTMVDTVVNWIGLSVSAQRLVSPNRSFSLSSSAWVYRRLAGSILIWQRSAIASTRSPLVSLIRSFRFMDGTSANRSGSTPVQSNTRSAMSGGLLTEYLGAGPDPAEELVDARPCLG